MILPDNGTDIIWLSLGIAGQAAFFMRFLAQWITSERKRESTIPVSFWYFSIAGGIALLAYAIHRKDPVFIAGQSGGVVVYVRNLYFILRSARERREQAELR